MRGHIFNNGLKVGATHRRKRGLCYLPSRSPQTMHFAIQSRSGRTVQRTPLLLLRLFLPSSSPPLVAQPLSKTCSRSRSGVCTGKDSTCTSLLSTTMRNDGKCASGSERCSQTCLAKHSLLLKLFPAQAGSDCRHASTTKQASTFTALLSMARAMATVERFWCGKVKPVLMSWRRLSLR